MIFKAKKALGRQFSDGEVIIKQGEEGDCLYVIQQGRVEVIDESDGNETKLAELKEADFFGEMGLFEKDIRSCTIRSLGGTKVLTIDKRNFFRTVQKDPSIAYRILEMMSSRLRESNRLLKEKT
jgi:CRP/FNR family cyclic AMP-dependent transcriptional regulator